MGIASLVYGAALLWLGVPQAREFLELLRQKLRLQGK
jgi:hypothetical protein